MYACHRACHGQPEVAKTEITLAIKYGLSFLAHWCRLDFTRSKIYELLQSLLCFGSAEVKLTSGRYFMLSGRLVTCEHRGIGQNLGGCNKPYPRQCVERSLPESVRS